MSIKVFKQSPFEFRVYEEIPGDCFIFRIEVKSHQKVNGSHWNQKVDLLKSAMEPSDSISFDIEFITGGTYQIVVPRETFYTESIAGIVEACMPKDFMKWAEPYDNLAETYYKWIVKEIQKSTSSLPLAPHPKYHIGGYVGGWNNMGYIDMENPYASVMKSGSMSKSESPEALSQKLPGVNEVVTNPVTGQKGILWNVIQHLNDREKWTREEIADWVETLDVDIRFKTDET